MAHASSRIFLFVHLRAAGGGWQGLSDRFPSLFSDWTEAVQVGVFMGLFGIRNQDLLVLLSLPDRGDAGEKAVASLCISEPVALLRSADRHGERGRMLLLTWYDNLTSWERSRTPHPEATTNFRRRAALAKSAIAYATRLADTVSR